MTMLNPMIEYLQKATGISDTFAFARQKFLYSTLNLKGYADSTTGLVSRQKLSFFQAKANTPGQGYVQSLHHGLTNFAGSPGTMPNDETYVARALGVRIIQRPGQTPRSAAQHLTNGSTSLDVRRGDSTAHALGPIELWPCGRYGYHSSAVAALGAAPANGAVTLFEFGQNGDSGMRILDQGSELAFLPGGTIEVNLHIHEPFYLTDDGEAATSAADIRDFELMLLFDGYSLGKVAS